MWCELEFELATNHRVLKWSLVFRNVVVTQRFCDKTKQKLIIFMNLNYKQYCQYNTVLYLCVNECVSYSVVNRLKKRN